MRVAVLIDAWLPFLGGGQKAVLEVSKILIKEKKATFVVFHGFNPHIIFRCLWCGYVIPQFIFYHLFINRFDLIDARAFLSGFPAKLLSLILGVPVIFTVNGCGNLDGRRRGLLSWVEKFLLTGIKYNQEISDSQHFLKYPNVNKNILVIPNGVNVNEFDKVKIPKSKIFTIIYVGRLAKIKGLDYLLQAVKEIKEKNKNFILKIAGKGEEEGVLKKYVKGNKLEKWVKFIGEVKGERLIKEFKSSHLFLLPSLAEGQPITLLEAWAAKLPVVASSVGGIPFFVNSGNGWLVKPADTQGLSKAIVRAMDSLRAKLLSKGKNGYLLVKINYTWDKSAQSYFNIYKKVVKNK